MFGKQKIRVLPGKLFLTIKNHIRLVVLAMMKVIPTMFGLEQARTLVAGMLVLAMVFIKVKMVAIPGP